MYLVGGYSRFLSFEEDRDSDELRPQRHVQVVEHMDMQEPCNDDVGECHMVACSRESQMPQKMPRTLQRRNVPICLNDEVPNDSEYVQASLDMPVLCPAIALENAIELIATKEATIVDLEKKLSKLCIN